MCWEAWWPMASSVHTRKSFAVGPDNHAGWCASLALGFAREGERTVLRERRHVGPLRVQRPFYPEGPAACHVYVLHPPGGVVGGDRLDIAGTVDAGASALLTTPAAGKFYTSSGPVAVQNQHWRVRDGATLEWLPQENIIYDGTNAVLSLHVEVAPEAQFLGWEVLCLGRPASGHRFLSGSLRTRMEIWRDTVPLYIERNRFDAPGEIFAARWGLAQHCVTGTLLCTGRYAAQLDSLRERASASVSAGWVAMTQLPDVLVCRYLGSSTEEARGCFWQLWELLRPLALGRAPCRPRIWDT